MVANVQPLMIRLDYLLLRHWCRAKYLPKSHPLSKTLLQFRSCYNKIIKQNNNKNKYIFQSPLYRAEWIIDSKYPTSISSTTNVVRNHITSLPCYCIKTIPTNYSVSLSPILKSQINDSSINFYVDGSCNPNPGMGAYGWFSPSYNSHRSLSQTKTCKFPVSINQCEAKAIALLLKYINGNPPTNHQNAQFINIYCDSLQILQFLKFHSYPKYNNLKIIIEQCLCQLLSIQSKYKNIHINLFKVKSHTDISGNIQIDKPVQKKFHIMTH